MIKNKLSDSSHFIFQIYQYDSWGYDTNFKFMAGFDDNWTNMKLSKDGKISITNFPSEEHRMSFLRLLKLFRKQGICKLLDDYCEALRDNCWTPHPAEYKIIFLENGKTLADWKNYIGHIGAHLPDGIFAEIVKTIKAISDKRDVYLLPDHYNDSFEKVNYVKKVILNKKGEPKWIGDDLIDAVSIKLFNEHRKDWWKGLFQKSLELEFERFLKSLDDNLIDWREGLTDEEAKEAENYIIEYLGKDSKYL